MALARHVTPTLTIWPRPLSEPKVDFSQPDLRFGRRDDLVSPTVRLVDESGGSLASSASSRLVGLPLRRLLVFAAARRTGKRSPARHDRVRRRAPGGSPGTASDRHYARLWRPSCGGAVDAKALVRPNPSVRPSSCSADGGWRPRAECRDDGCSARASRQGPASAPRSSRRSPHRPAGKQGADEALGLPFVCGR